MDASTIVGLDFETYSAAPLPKVGLKKYVEDPTFTVTLAAVASWAGTTHAEFPDKKTLVSMLQGTTVVAHNAGFERAVLLSMGIDIPVYDSAVVAAVAGADRHLAGAARQLLNMTKLDDDRSLLRLFAMPQPEAETLEFDMSLVHDNPDKWTEFIEYCERDAELSRAIFLDWAGDPALHEREMLYASITLAMNEAGWPVDIAAVGEMRDRYNANLDQIQDDFAKRADKDLNLFSHDQVKQWCADRGVRSSSFDKQNVEKLRKRLLKQRDKRPLTQGEEEVLFLLETKIELGGSSLKKLETILDTAYDGRVYDQYVHAGAPQSLRTSGRSIQMQNLPRLPAKPRPMRELHTPKHWTNDELGENLRQVFRSSDPHGNLVVADFASIESRALAYLAGEDWKLEAYRRGEDIYKAQAMKIFGLVHVDAVSKEQRTTGKVGELSCGYGAGPVAVKDFAAKMHVDLTEGEAKQLVMDWREANPHTVQFWYKLGDALVEAVSETKTVAVHAAHGIAVKFRPSTTPTSLMDQDPDVQSIRMDVWKDGHLILSRVFHGCYMRGRNVGYYKPSSLKGGKPWKKRYTDPKTGLPRFYELYGGKLAGILTQSLCREIFFESLLRLDSSLNSFDNVTMVGQFHDEVVVDWVPAQRHMLNTLGMTDLAHRIEKAMSSSLMHPALPMAVEVKFDYRYTK